MLYLVESGAMMLSGDRIIRGGMTSLGLRAGITSLGPTSTSPALCITATLSFFKLMWLSVLFFTLLLVLVVDLGDNASYSCSEWLSFSAALDIIRAMLFSMVLSAGSLALGGS